MQNEEIKKNYLKKIKRFNDCNKNYYDKSKPLVSDAEFDELKAEILELEKKYDFLENSNSPSSSIGFKPSKKFKKVNHNVAMLSLANDFEEEDLKNF